MQVFRLRKANPLETSQRSPLNRYEQVEQEWVELSRSSNRFARIPKRVELEIGLNVKDELMVDLPKNTE